MNNIDRVIDALKIYITRLDEEFMNQSDTNLNISLLEVGNYESKTSVSEEFVNLINVLDEIKSKITVIPYSKITFFIYEEMSNRRELIDRLDGNLEEDFDLYLNTNDIDDNTKYLFLKIKEHISLSIVQRNHINFSLTERIEVVDSKLQEAEETIEFLEEEIISIEKSAQEKSDKITVQFITILGIFSAIMMATIGSFQGFTSIFSNADNLPIGKTLIISAMGASGVSLILFLLLYSLSKLISKPLSNCNCKRKNTDLLSRLRMGLFGNNEQMCSCSFFEKYPAIILINYLFYYMFVIGFTFIYFNINNYFNMNPLKQATVLVIIFLFSTIVLILVHRYLLNKKSNITFVGKIKSDLKKTKIHLLFNN